MPPVGRRARGNLGIGVAAAGVVATGPALFSLAWFFRGNSLWALWARVDTWVYAGVLWGLARWPAPGARRMRVLALLYAGLGLTSALLHGHVFPGRGLEFSGDRKWRGKNVYQTSDAELTEGLCHLALHAVTWAMLARSGGRGTPPPPPEPVGGFRRVRRAWPVLRTVLAPLLFGLLLLELNPRALTWSMYATFHPATMKRIDVNTNLDGFMEMAQANDYWKGRGDPWLHTHFQRRGRELVPHDIAMPFYQGLDIAPLKQMQTEIITYTPEEWQARIDRVANATRSQFWQGKYLASLDLSPVSPLGNIGGLGTVRALTLALDDKNFNRFNAHVKAMFKRGELPLICGTLFELPLDSLYQVYKIYDAIPKDQHDQSSVPPHVFSRLVLLVDKPFCGKQEGREVTPLKSLLGRTGSDLLFSDSEAPRSGSLVGLFFGLLLILDVLFVAVACRGEVWVSVLALGATGVQGLSEFGGWVELQLNETFGAGFVDSAAGTTFYQNEGERMEEGGARGGAGGGGGAAGDARWEKFQHGIDNLVKDAQKREEARELLGVTTEADPEDIRKAYKRLAVRWHPDKNRDQLEEAEEMFKRVQQAASILLPKDQ